MGSPIQFYRGEKSASVADFLFHVLQDLLLEFDSHLAHLKYPCYYWFMHKKHILIVLLAVGLLAAIAFVLLNNTDKQSSMTADEAIQQAREYQPETPCLTVLVDAVHKETGARYMFPSSCLAPGWEPDD